VGGVSRTIPARYDGAYIAKRPRFVLFENVKALTTYKFAPTFRRWQNELADYGYTNYAKVLNAKDYGVPQNRERIFMVSILGDGGSYVFPNPVPLTTHVCDLLEPQVDECYYLRPPKIHAIADHTAQLTPTANRSIYARKDYMKLKYSQTLDYANTVTTLTGSANTQDQYVLTNSL